ncbi:MAG TPA: response regulator [Mariprofundaceae bacterium]|nr:response regulator [Mariprofundaceae bacterium]
MGAGVNKQAKHILAIDDDIYALELYEAAIEDSGYTLDTAQSGREGIECAKALTPDLIFLDLMMPVLNGIETLECLRDFLPKVPVYMVTAFDRSLDDLIRPERANDLAFEVCRKPITAAQLREIADSLLQDPAAAAQPVPEAAVHTGQALDLRLYVAGQTANSVQAQENIRAALKTWGGHYHLEVLDVIKHPRSAAADHIVATPTLLKLDPQPTCRLIGRFADHTALLEALGLSGAWAKLSSTDE